MPPSVVVRINLLIEQNQQLELSLGGTTPLLSKRVPKSHLRMQTNRYQCILSLRARSAVLPRRLAPLASIVRENVRETWRRRGAIPADRQPPRTPLRARHRPDSTTKHQATTSVVGSSVLVSMPLGTRWPRETTRLQAVGTWRSVSFSNRPSGDLSGVAISKKSCCVCLSILLVVTQIVVTRASLIRSAIDSISRWFSGIGERAGGTAGDSGLPWRRCLPWWRRCDVVEFNTTARSS